MGNIYDYKTTRAVVIERPREVRLRTIQLTEPGPDAYVAQTLFSSISSGTDMKTWRGEQHPEQCWYPLVPGYENAGVIVAAGPKSDPRLKVGDRVMINECRLYGDVCAAWGGGSEFTIKDSKTTNNTFDYMVKIPDNVSYEEAVLAYLPCVALKGVRRLTLRPKMTVVVSGAGMVGISAIQILRILCPEMTIICIEPNAFRQEIAAHYADYVVSPDEAEALIGKVTGGKKADRLIECSGNPAVVGTLHRYIKDGGWGADDEPAHIHLQGDYPEQIIMDYYHRWFVKNCTITMSCSLAAGCKEQILEWISTGRLDLKKLPIEIWPVSKCAEAFAYKQEKGEDVFKILFDWSK
ncbi:MAG: zinc-binding dehydrogenase [Subdoligranulum variabile]|nr:MAG: zinc-binding dehydrogenase [Subdoligranulum variabile]